MTIPEALLYVAAHFWIAGVTTEHIARKLVAERQWLRDTAAVLMGIFWPVFFILRLVHDISKVGSEK